jgi:hypothetical protein
LDEYRTFKPYVFSRSFTPIGIMDSEEKTNKTISIIKRRLCGAISVSEIPNTIVYGKTEIRKRKIRL